MNKASCRSFRTFSFTIIFMDMLAQGFRKVATSRWEFCNDMFRRGERELLCEIRRRKAWAKQQQQQQQQAEGEGEGEGVGGQAVQNGVEEPDHEEDQRSSSTSSSSGYSSLVDENKRLKKENGVLCSELTSMKNKCRELLDLVAIYAGPEKEEEGDERPKLFGVRLEVEGERERKRKRAEISETASYLLSQSCK